MADIKVTIVENGPCLIDGTATYIDADGNEQKTDRERVALCRCGLSSNKPFCDGTHRAEGFSAAAVDLSITQ
jgi:CDGSH-type Zn-finger protein